MLIDVNESVLKLYGCAKEELIEKPADVVAPVIGKVFANHDKPKPL